MTDGNSVNKPSSSDEVDIGRLIRLIRNGLRAIFKRLLRLFLYLKANFILLAVLMFTGFAIGYVLKFFSTAQLKTEVIVQPNFDSKDYLYNVIEEIGTNLMVKDSAFFKELDLEVSELKYLSIQIEPVQEEVDQADFKNDIRYLESLQNYRDETFVLDVVKSTLQKNNNKNHRITFFYKNAVAGRAATVKLMEYIESNEYFSQLKKISVENSLDKIEKNIEVIAQIDDLIKGYSRDLAEGNRAGSGTLSIEDENGLDITNILKFKSNLVKDVGLQKLDLVHQKEVIKIVNFGRTQKVGTPIYAQGVTVVPIIFLFFFFMYSLIRYLNKKAKELEAQTDD